MKVVVWSGLRKRMNDGSTRAGAYRSDIADLQGIWPLHPICAGVGNWSRRHGTIMRNSDHLGWKLREKLLVAVCKGARDGDQTSEVGMAKQLSLGLALKPRPGKYMGLIIKRGAKVPERIDAVKIAPIDSRETGAA